MMKNTAMVNHRWKSAILSLVVVILFYLAMAFSVTPLSSLVRDHFPENYAWQTQQALQAKDFTRAAEIAQARVRNEHYDFKARRLLAKSQIGETHTSAVVATMLESVDRGLTISGRDVYTVGYDPAADYALLSQALREAGRIVFADEMGRVALDNNRRARSGTEESITSVSTQMNDPSQKPVGGFLDLRSFNLEQGVTLTDSGSLLFTRNGTARGLLPNTPTAPETLYLQVLGGRAMGIGGLLKITLNGHELIRVYAENAEPRWITIPFSDETFSETMRLTVEFINDGFDPVTKTDRNIELLKIAIH